MKTAEYSTSVTECRKLAQFSKIQIAFNDAIGLIFAEYAQKFNNSKSNVKSDLDSINRIESVVRSGHADLQMLYSLRSVVNSAQSKGRTLDTYSLTATIRRMQKLRDSKKLFFNA